MSKVNTTELEKAKDILNGISLTKKIESSYEDILDIWATTKIISYSNGDKIKNNNSSENEYDYISMNNQHAIVDECDELKKIKEDLLERVEQKMHELSKILNSSIETITTSQREMLEALSSSIAADAISASNGEFIAKENIITDDLDVWFEGEITWKKRKENGKDVYLIYKDGIPMGWTDKNGKEAIKEYRLNYDNDYIERQEQKKEKTESADSPQEVKQQIEQMESADSLQKAKQQIENISNPPVNNKITPINNTIIAEEIDLVDLHNQEKIEAFMIENNPEKVTDPNSVYGRTDNDQGLRYNDNTGKFTYYANSGQTQYELDDELALELYKSIKENK